MNTSEERDGGAYSVTEPSGESRDAALLKHRERQIDAMHRISEALLYFSSIEEIVRETLVVAIDVLRAEVGSLQLYDPLTDTLVFRHVIDPRAGVLVGHAVPAAEGINGKAFRTGKSSLTRHAPDDAEWNSAVDDVTGYQTNSMLTVPLRRPGGSPIGVAQVLNAQEEFDACDLEVLEVLCAQAAIAMTAARLREESDQRLLRLQTLRSLDLALTASLDSQMTLNALVEQARALPGVDAVCVLLFQPSTRKLTYTAGSGFRGRTMALTQLTLGEGYAGRAALERHAISVYDLKTEASNFVRFNLIQEEEFVLYHAIPMVANGQIKGTMEVFGRGARTFDSEHVEFLEAMATQAAVALEKVAIFEALKRTNIELGAVYDDTLVSIAKALDMRDREPEGHTERVTNFTLRLAQHMGVPDAELVHYRRGALLHDIGKMGIPDAILMKSSPLTEDEWAVMKKHPSYAYELLSSIPLLRPALDIPYCHHERWDGSGYPCGLAGEQIPLSARIFALADAWDAMGVDRPYRAGWPLDKIRQHIVKNSGSHFDPSVVTAFEQMHF